MVGNPQITAFCERIIEQYKPEKIVLFGSYAYGKPTPDSDVDILVVLPFEGLNAQKSAEILTHTNPRFPIDLLVRTPEQIRQRLELGDFFLQEIIEKGKVIYESPE